jgi:hypothetical protein
VSRLSKPTGRYGALALALLGAAILLAAFVTGVRASPPSHTLSHTPTYAASPTLSHVSTPITLPSPSWRIGITADGLYRLSYETLAAAGVPVTDAAPPDLHLLWRGQEVALQEVGTADGTFDPGDALLFYAEKFHGSVQDEKYTDENVYWLAVYSTTPGLRMESRSVPPDGAGQPLGWYTATVRAEENLVHWSRHSNTPGTDATWFWELMKASVTTYTHAITITDPAPGAYTATLTVEMAARKADPYNHQLRFTLNGTPVGETSWTGKKGWVATLPVSATLIQEGANTLDIAVLTAHDTVYLNWIEICYRRHPVAQDDALLLTSPLSGTAAMTLTGFSTSTAYLYDVTHPLTPTRLVSAAASLSGTAHTLALSDTAPAGTTYLAVAEPAVTDVPSLSAYYPPDDLISPTVGADEIIIAPADFLTAVQPLVDLRTSQGLRVRVVEVNDTYALLNDGIFHPEAIRAFVAHAYAYWPGDPPAYLLLVGDGNFNFKGYNPATYGAFVPTWIPPYLEFADPGQGEVAVDSRFGDVDDDHMPEVAVGRIPAGTVEEVETAVGKIVDYEADLASPWRNSLLFAADNVPDAAGDFEASLDRLRALVPEDLSQRQVYLTDYCGPPTSPPTKCPAATLALTQTWSAGVAMVTYAGHGSVDFWANEQLLIPADIPTFQPGHGLPFVISLDCLDGYWMFPPSYPTVGTETRSLAEVLLLTPERGAVAVFAPAGLGTVAVEEALARAMYQAMFEDDTWELGPLTQAGREAVSLSYMARTYTLFGDPAMRLVLLPMPCHSYLPLILQDS